MESKTSPFPKHILEAREERMRKRIHGQHKGSGSPANSSMPIFPQSEEDIIKALTGVCIQKGLLLNKCHTQEEEGNIKESYMSALGAMKAYLGGLLDERHRLDPNTPEIHYAEDGESPQLNEAFQELLTQAKIKAKPTLETLTTLTAGSEEERAAISHAQRIAMQANIHRGQAAAMHYLPNSDLFANVVPQKQH